MAIDSLGIGAFIPNAAGNPQILSLSPVEKAQVSAEKAREQNDAQKASQQSAVVNNGTAESESVNSVGETVDIDA